MVSAAGVRASSKGVEYAENYQPYVRWLTGRSTVDSWVMVGSVVPAKQISKMRGRVLQSLVFPVAMIDHPSDWNSVIFLENEIRTFLSRKPNLELERGLLRQVLKIKEI